ncbi:MAG: 2-amino-4-hydroxy-6-hydroxymethyldihydropteridine pyrophosphokinae [Pseudomonadota bacterium]|jgi:2-amino-4-hydroxy-6-hydroxymethyldihydropteridine diphosphokinase
MTAVAREPVTAFVALGANLGDALHTVRAACAALGDCPGVQLLRCSRLYRSAPIESSGPDYINAVVEVRTTLSAPDLLTVLQALENAAGRERPYHNAPRTLDLDLLLYGAGRIQSSRLTVPHPRMNARAFVLLPLADIAPHWVSAQQLQAVHDQALEALA